MPLKRRASSKAAADLPLAVGPAIRIARLSTPRASGDGDRHEAKASLGVRDQ
jgi:hypothetical protein